MNQFGAGTISDLSADRVFAGAGETNQQIIVLLSALAKFR
jgi:hypothetical protein